MVGLGESYLAPFALALGLGEIRAGLISSLPLLAGGLLQLVSLRAVSWIGSEKRWVVLCAAVQALAFIPLILTALAGSISLGMLLIIASVYWGAGLASGPAWNTWIQSVVPQKIRARYFAVRTRAGQFSTLLAFLVGGASLQWARGADVELGAFATLFSFALLFRLYSTFCLFRQTTLLPRTDYGAGPIVSQASERTPATPLVEHATTLQAGWRLLAFLVVMQGMLQVSGPFFAPFMFEQLGYSYLQFAILIGVAFATKGLAFSAWARLARRRGPAWMLWMGAVGIAPIAGFWVVSQNFYYLLAIQVCSGCAWAAYELGFFLLFFETLPVARRVRMLTLYNLENTIAWCLGALLGASVLAVLGTTYEAYLTLFGLSSVGRILALVLLARAIPPKLDPPVTVKKIGLRVLGLRLGSGSVNVPILPSLQGGSRRAAASIFRG